MGLHAHLEPKFLGASTVMMASLYRSKPSFLVRSNTLRFRAQFPSDSNHCWIPKRFFYSGMDDCRERRLRNAGSTFNKPRGRDTMSLAFEKRIRVLPLNEIRDLYGPVLDVPADGNTKRTLKVLVVDPLPLEKVEESVPFPSVHPLFYSERWNTRDSKHSKVFELKKREVASAFRMSTPLGLQAPSDSPNCLETPIVGHNFASFTDFHPLLRSASGDDAVDCFLAHKSRGQLRRNGDTSLVPGTWRPCAPPPDDARALEFFLALCVDPFLDVERFRREEAQVEMISAYRNILYEAAELPVFTPQGGGRAGRKAPTAVADVVRIPALACYSCGPRFLPELGKLSQQSLIKGYHRLSGEAKEALLQGGRGISVELFVPPPFVEGFAAAFAGEAWAAPLSVLDPGRTALYPGLPPPPTLLECEGWVGKRLELIEAVKTEGKSLARGPHFNLDGSPIQAEEVMAQAHLFGGRAEELRRLEGEHAMAQKQLGVPARSALYDATPLSPGLRDGT